MAVIVTSNFVTTFDCTITAIGGDWENLEALKDPNLAPVCRHRAGKGTKPALSVKFNGRIRPQTLALLGTNLPRASFHGWSPGGRNWFPEGFLYETEARDAFGTIIGPRHLISYFPQAPYTILSSQGVRINFADVDFEIGALWIGGRVLDDPQLADEGWSVEYVDTTPVSRSEGGQAFAAPQPQRRILRLAQGTLDSRFAFGVPTLKPGGAGIQGAPTRVDATPAGNYDTGNFSGRVYLFNNGPDPVTLVWRYPDIVSAADLQAPFAYVDYVLQPLISAAGVSCQARARWVDPVTGSSSNWKTLSMGRSIETFGTAAHGSASNLPVGDLEVELTVSGNGRVAFFPFKVGEYESGKWVTTNTLQAHLRSWPKSTPMLVFLRQDTPWAPHSMWYVRQSENPRIGDRGGDIFQSGLVLEEVL